LAVAVAVSDALADAGVKRANDRTNAIINFLIQMYPFLHHRYFRHLRTYL
jgi:hypothetical protein